MRIRSKWQSPSRDCAIRHLTRRVSGAFPNRLSCSPAVDLILLDLQKGRNLIQSLGDEPLHIMIWADMYGSVMVKLKKKYIQSDHE